jgi:UDP-N-acetylglucosamine 2-epimerase
MTEDSAFDALLCSTGQHKDLLYDAISDFDVTIDIELEAMQENASMADQLSYMMTHLQSVVTQHQPNLIVVQGDTLSAYCGAMIAFYNKIKLAHIEAGLRTGDKLSPFPEEIHRKFIDDVADYHFAHSEAARQVLLNEGHLTSHVYMVGNTGIDALLYMHQKLTQRKLNPGSEIKKIIESTKDQKIGLLTMHRRETMGEVQRDMLEIILDCAMSLGIKLICPKHPNPEVQKIYAGYNDNSHIIFTKSLDYKSMVWLMSQADIIYSDSGGIQEEAPYLGRRVVVLREITERQEVTNTGSHILYSKEKVIEDSKRIMNERKEVTSPYGDGQSSVKIIEILKKMN